jgi:hypothetical protein
LPDYASVTLSEPDAPEVISLLGRKGVGVEAGLATVRDAALCSASAKLQGFPYFD